MWNEESSKQLEDNTIDAQEKGNVTASMRGDDVSVNSSILLMMWNEKSSKQREDNTIEAQKKKIVTFSMRGDGETLVADDINDVSGNSLRQRNDDFIDAEEESNFVAPSSLDRMPRYRHALNTKRVSFAEKEKSKGSLQCI